MSRLKAPAIDQRSYGEIVDELEGLASSFTAGTVDATADLLTGAVLDEDVALPDGEGEVIVEAGTLIDPSLAARLELATLGPLKVRGWQRPGGSILVELKAHALAGAVLTDRIVLTDGTPVPAGQRIDPALALEIERKRVRFDRPLVLPRVRIQVQPDAGSALIRIFGRMAELAVARLNQLPERSFLSFLDLVGTHLEPPRPARAPLTFHLVEGSPVDTLVPARTQVAASPTETEPQPAVFETERDLLVTRSRLVAAFSREPGNDRYANYSLAMTGEAASFAPFRGLQPIEHQLYIGHGLFGLPEDKEVTLWITPVSHDHRWLSEVVWEAYDGLSSKPLSHQVTSEVMADGRTAWKVKLAVVREVPRAEINGTAGSWLRGSLTVPIPRGEAWALPGGRTEMRRQGLEPLAAFVEEGSFREPVDLGAPFWPFGKELPARSLYVAGNPDLARPGAWIDLEMTLDPTRLPEPSSTLALAWQYLDGGDPTATPPVPQAWKPLTGPVTFTPRGTPPAGASIQPFGVDGTVRFRCPADWRPGVEELGGGRTVKGLWLAVGIASGDYGSEEDYRPPVVRRLTWGDAWELPRIERLQVTTRITRTKLPMDLGAVNEAPVDLTKDFLPLGEKPRVGDAFYLASDEAFSKPEAKVDLHFTLTNAEKVTPEDTPTLVWEYWDGERWQKLGRSSSENGELDDGGHGFKDTTKAFTDNGTDGKVSFVCPVGIAPRELAGANRHWIRVRLDSGAYGTEASYTEVKVGGVTQRDVNGMPIHEYKPANFGPPSIKLVQVSYDYTVGPVAPDLVRTENDFTFAAPTPPTAPFFPFTPSVDLRPTLYLGFERPGEAVGFANRSNTLYFGVSRALFDPAAERRDVSEQPVVAWEYWNGERWQRLGTRDETRGFTRRGLLTFVGPADFFASTELGRRVFWLRGRWESGNYAAEPHLERILTNTVWAVHALTLENEELGSSRGERGQVFRTRQVPVLEGQRLDIVEPELPSAAEAAEITAEEGEDALRTTADATGRVTEIRVRWHEVKDFYASGPRSRHYVLDRLTGEVRFGDGLRGLVPPPGRGNVQMAFYQTGGGLAGNLPAGSLTQLKGTVPYVDSVSQPEPATGGAAQESLEAAAVRGPKALRHRDRAAALDDFEDLAFQASTEVARAKGIAARDEETAGRVGLIVVPRSSEIKPVPSLELIERVRGYIEARLSPVAELWVVGPDWLEVTVRAEIVPQVLEAAAEVQSAVLERLRAFLHPLTGGLDGEGWAFGRKPYRSDLYAWIEQTPGVDHVRRLETREEPFEGTARPERFLVFSGDHLITMAGGTDEAAGRNGSAG